MYDTVSWGDSLPFSPEMVELGLDKCDWEFQTKDLWCGFDHYVVQGGKLHLRKYKVEEWIEGDPDADLFTGKLGYLDRRDPYLEPSNITNTIHVYEWRDSVQDKWDCWIEFEVIIVAGQITSVKLIEFRKQSNEERIRRDEEFARNLEFQRGRLINKYFFDTPVYYVPAIHLRRGLYALSNLLLRLANKL